MLSLAELIDTIATKSLMKSKVNDFIGGNIRCPKLIPGTLYILKQWTIKHQMNSDNPFLVARFIGSGREDTGERVLFAENPMINKMVDGDYFYFETIDEKDEDYVFGAYMFENCVCITSSAVRITCYEVKGYEAEPSDDKPIRAPKTPAAPRERTSSTPRTRSTVSASKIPSIDREDIVIEDEDDGLGCPSAVVCHPISLAPLRRQPREVRA